MNPIEKALETADKVIAANAELERISSGGMARGVKIWTVQEFKEELRKYNSAGGLPDTAYYDSVIALGVRSHSRGDGLAVYENVDLGHPELGHWKVVSYGSAVSLLQTRGEAFLGHERLAHGQDSVPLGLPDMGADINWRYRLKAVVPSYGQVDWTREQPQADPHDRLVTLTVKVTGGASEEEAKVLIAALIDNAVENWEDSGGQTGFSITDDTGTIIHDRGVGIEVIDAAVI